MTKFAGPISHLVQVHFGLVDRRDLQQVEGGGVEEEEGDERGHPHKVMHAGDALRGVLLDVAGADHERGVEDTRQVAEPVAIAAVNVLVGLLLISITESEPSARRVA